MVDTEQGHKLSFYKLPNPQFMALASIVLEKEIL